MRLILLTVLPIEHSMSLHYFFSYYFWWQNFILQTLAAIYVIHCIGGANLLQFKSVQRFP